MAADTYLEVLIVLKSLGKFFGLAGARVGFVLAQPRYLIAMQEMLGPWTLSGASRFIAKKALLDSPWQQNTRAQLLADSEKLSTLLRQFNLTPTGGTALFQYVQSRDAVRMHHALAAQGVWLRLFNHGSKPTSAIRICLPLAADWHRLEIALRNIN